MSASSPLISTNTLKSIMRQANLVIIDASAGPNAKDNYEKNHLEGARFVDLEKDLSGDKSDPSRGGRHPLPNITHFSQLLGRLGISSSTHVVVYDDKGAANAASRLWWMLRAVGHEKVQVLNGGSQAAVKEGIATSAKVVKPSTAPPYPAKDWILPVADINQVEKVAQSDDHLVIDVRDKYRYDGESEPIDLVAGHIPGATNLPFVENLDSEGKYLPPEVLKEKYSIALAGKGPENIIVHCGSGVTACHTILAMAYAGLEIPKLYVGSWSEWSRTGRPMITKD